MEEKELKFFDKNQIKLIVQVLGSLNIKIEAVVVDLILSFNEELSLKRKKITIEEIEDIAQKIIIKYKN